MLKSTNPTDLANILRARLDISVLKKSRKHSDANTVSVAVSESGKYYIGGKIESDTNLLDMSSEQTALLKAVQQRDVDIREVVTLADDEHFIISPISLKILVDFGNRIGHTPGYRVITKNGKTVFQAKNISKAMPFYKPRYQRLKLPKRSPQKNWVYTHIGEKPNAILKKYALRGLTLALPTYDGASAYGAAVLTKEKRIYFSGQYSAPDKRLNVHAEMAAIASALMEGEKKITHLGLVSDKFENEPCAVCGCCRQFIHELSRKFDWNMKIFCFAKNSSAYRVYSINKLLPASWSSKNWQ